MPKTIHDFNVVLKKVPIGELAARKQLRLAVRLGEQRANRLTVFNKLGDFWGQTRV